jgi:ABC-type Na+ efflux pump permease subunit
MEPEKKSNGALVGLIIIIIILVIGGIYIWQSKVQSALEEKKLQSENVTPSDTDELNNLEQDLNTVDTNVGVDVDAVN